ncbi:hypothetical protein [Bacillus atrophaeus]|uniref:hypothetical protein n=1 Tax=Bacillus atrophaeus TaxID=1452 RepID=UPI002E219ECD|nr:hypothetical protein [Bacillus atrophaeus]
MKRSAPANTPAIAARHTVRNKGSKSATAKRVAGSEPLKMSTPRKPFIQPFVALFITITPKYVSSHKIIFSLIKTSIKGLQ